MLFLVLRLNFSKFCSESRSITLKKKRKKYSNLLENGKISNEVHCAKLMITSQRSLFESSLMVLIIIWNIEIYGDRFLIVAYTISVTMWYLV